MPDKNTEDGEVNRRDFFHKAAAPAVAFMTGAGAGFPIGRNSTYKDPITELHASQLAIQRTAADYPHFSLDDINMIIEAYRDNYTLTRTMDPNDVKKELKKEQPLPDKAPYPPDLNLPPVPPDNPGHRPEPTYPRRPNAGPNSTLIANRESPGPSTSNRGRG